MEQRRFPPPWSFEERPESFIVHDANGQPLAYLYFEEMELRRTQQRRLTKDEARRIARAIARLPELMQAGDTQSPVIGRSPSKGN